MLEQPAPFNFYTFSPLFILAFFITHGKQEIGQWLRDFAFDYELTDLLPLASFMSNHNDFTFFSVFFITLFSSLFFMLWRFDVHCNRMRAFETQERKRSH